MLSAAKEESSLPFTSGAMRGLAETRIGGSNLSGTTRIGPQSWLSSTTRPACEYRCDGTASALLVQRYYSSGTGSFFSPDPSGIKAARPKKPNSWNMYAYVNGDPVNHNDPTGLNVFSGIWNAISSFFGGGDDMAEIEDDGGDDGGGGGGWDPCYGDEFSPSPSPACYAPVPLPPPVASSPPPSCSLELEYRQAALTGRSHASLVVTDSSGFTFTMQGQPQNYPLPKGVPPTWGNLVVSNTPGNIGNQQWGSTLTSATDANLCNQVSDIETAENYYSNNPVTYYPWGPNSNSLVHWLLESGYVDQYFTAPPKTTGWNTALYGTILGIH